VSKGAAAGRGTPPRLDEESAMQYTENCRVVMPGLGLVEGKEGECFICDTDLII
jgi:hypothetical protein